MSPIGTIKALISGDIGGVGVSQWRFERTDSGPITSVEAGAVGAAVHDFYDAIHGVLPANIRVDIDGVCDIYDVATGLVAGPVPVTPLPIQVVGSDSSFYPAGVGARVNFHTDLVIGRRLLRGAIFVVPLGGASYNGDGSIGSTATGDINTAVAAYLAAVTLADCNPVIWRRPAKGTFTGGVSSPTFAGTVPSIPAGLRSRRV